MFNRSSHQVIPNGLKGRLVVRLAQVAVAISNRLDALGGRVAALESFDERVAVAQTCHAKLNYSMPLLVDAINDPVGHAYSGMPSRLYVIDPREP